MRLKFNSIKYKNLMSIGNTFTEVSLDDFKNTLITGKNGSAKSTLLEAIFYVLFDTPFRKIKMGQLINSTNKKNLVVELSLEKGTDKVIIKRGQKPTIFEILINGKEMEQSGGKRETQTRLESYLGINAVSFRQVVVLGTAGYSPFMELSTPERRTLVEDILDLSSIAKMDKINKDIVRNLNQDMSLTSQKIDSMIDKRETLQRINETQQRQYQERVQRIKSELESAESQKQKALELVKEKKYEYDSFEKIELDLDEYRIKRDKIKDAISKTNHSITDITKKINLHKMGKCPTCEGDLESVHALELEPQLEKSKVMRDKLNTALHTVEASYNEYIQNSNKVESMKKALVDISQKYKELDSKVKSLENAVAEAPVEVDTEDDIKECNLKLQEMNKEKEEQIKEKYNRGMLTELFKDSGIKAKIVGFYIPFLNQRINHYLELLEADYNFTLDTEFNEQIKSVGRENFTYHSFSQGEKARIDISMLFAWRDVAAKISGADINLLILDEVFDGPSDSDCKGNIMSILESMDSNIFVISHADHDPQDYNRHIKMTKVGRFSQMEINS